MSNQTKATALLIAIAMIVLSPLDPIPDAIPFLGTVDDFFIMYYGVQKVMTLRQAD